MRIGLLEKKLEGGGQIDPPPLPCNRWENSPPEKGLKARGSKSGDMSGFMVLEVLFLFE